MKKLVLTTLTSLITIIGFSQTLTATDFVSQITKTGEAKKDTMYILNTLDSAMHADYNDTIGTSLLTLSARYNKREHGLKVIKSIRKKYKKDVQPTLLLANAYRYNSNTKKALKYFKKGEKLAKKNNQNLNPDTYTNMSKCYENLGKYEEALKYNNLHLNRDLEAIYGRITKETKLLAGLIDKAKIYNELGRPNDAIAVLDSIVNDSYLKAKINGGYFRYYYVYGHSYYLLNDYEKAANMLEKHQRVYRGRYDWISHYFLAKCYEQLDNKDRACLYYGKALHTSANFKKNATKEDAEKTARTKTWLGYINDIEAKVKEYSCE